MLSEQGEYPEVICPARNLFEGFVLVGARHSDPLWRLARLNAEYATVGDQSLPFSGQLLGSKLWAYFQLVILGSIESSLKHYDCYLFPGITPMANSACLVYTFHIESSNTRSPSCLDTVTLDHRTLQWCFGAIGH